MTSDKTMVEEMARAIWREIGPSNSGWTFEQDRDDMIEIAQAAATIAQRRVEELREALKLAVPILEEEREVMVSSYTVLYAGSPDVGKVVDPTAVEWLATCDAALDAARSALNPKGE